MAKVIRKLSADDDMDYMDIVSFKTESYVGVWNFREEEFLIFGQSDTEFYPIPVGKGCKDLQELDDQVYNEVDQHIEEVFDLSNYEFKLNVD